MDVDRQGRQFTARHLAAVWVMMEAGESYRRIEQALYLSPDSLVVNVRTWERSYAAATLRIGDGAADRKRGGWRAEVEYVRQALGYKRSWWAQLREWFTGGDVKAVMGADERWRALQTAMTLTPDTSTTGWFGDDNR
jgi:hypothetical protein